MTVYNKLKVAILMIISSQTISAITLSPLQIQSGSGDLLYAEMKFSHSNPNQKIEVGLAEPEDLTSMGISHQPPGHLNFFTRRSSDGTGVIVITSSRPVIESELNILLKIKEGNASRIQQIKTPLTRNRQSNEIKASNHEKSLKPQIIVSEKDIALNLPTSTQYQTTTRTSNADSKDITKPAKNNQTALVISSSAPPVLSVVKPSTVKPSLSTKTASVAIQKNSTISPKPAQASTTIAKIKAPTVPQPDIKKPILVKDKPQITVQKNQKENVQNNIKPTTDQALNQNTQKKNTAESKSTLNKVNKPTSLQSKNPTSNEKYTVQANESLWKIAARIAAQTNQSIPTVMQQIKQNNQHAFIQGDINRIRQGFVLTIATTPLPAQPNKSSQTNASSIQQKQSGTAKYRLNQAEMSLTTDSEQNAKNGHLRKDAQQNQTNADLSSKVMTARQKTVKLQNNVSQLSSALQQKDHRIQLLNARLAQLQQQLLLQTRTEKTKH